MVSGRAFDRLVNFTDAVVAVAITLLVLAIVDIRGTSSEQTVWQIVGDHGSEITTFLFTFVVVAVMWQVHNRVFNRLHGYDSVVFWLNLAWLVGIAFLPWPSALYGEGIGVNAGQWSGGQGLGGAGLLYWGTLAWLSLATQLIAWHVRAHPELVDPSAGPDSRHPLRGFVFAAAFIVFGIVSLFAPGLSQWLPFLLIPLGTRFGSREQQDDDDPVGV